MTSEGAAVPLDRRWRPQVGLTLVQGMTSDKETRKLLGVLSRVATRLNDSFGPDGPKFNTFENECLLANAERTGERARVYKKDQYWDALAGSQAMRSSDFLIGLCAHQLPESSFNLESRENRVAIVSVANYEEYRPPLMTMEAFASYLIICVLMLLQDHTIVEHEASVGCLFDVCIDPSELTSGLRKPSFEHCRNRAEKPLAQWPTEVLNGYAGALKDVGRKDASAISSSALGNRVLGALAGVMVAFLTNLSVAEAPRLAICLALATIVAAAVFGLLRGISSYEWFKRRRAEMFWAIVVTALAGVLAASYYTFSTGWPRLPSQEHSARPGGRVKS